MYSVVVGQFWQVIRQFNKHGVGKPLAVSNPQCYPQFSNKICG